jgi:hypothetical protein
MLPTEAVELPAVAWNRAKVVAFSLSQRLLRGLLHHLLVPLALSRRGSWRS